MINLACRIWRNKKRLFLIRFQFVYGPGTVFRHSMEKKISDLACFSNTPWVESEPVFLK